MVKQSPSAFLFCSAGFGPNRQAELSEVPLEAGGACPAFITGNPSPAKRDFTSFSLK